MRKIRIAVFFAVSAAGLLLAFAFFYIAFTTHKISIYDIYHDGQWYGTAKVDKFVTENKVILMSQAELPGSVDLPVIRQKLVLDRNTFLPLRYSAEWRGTRGSSKSQTVVQAFDRTDLVFLDPPVFFRLKGFETGEKTVLFTPDSVISYITLIEHYNLWKKGTQRIEVMMLPDAPLPVLRDKIEMRFLQDEYVPVMGRRHESERYLIKSAGINEAFAGYTKYAHSLLYAEWPNRKLRFVLKDSYRKFERVFSLFSVFRGKERAATRANGGGDLPEIGPPMIFHEGEERVPHREVFFEDNKLILSGRLWMPSGKGPFPGAVLVRDDGPLTSGENMLFKSLGEELSKRGIAVLDFDNPGQGKSQGNYGQADDKARIKSIGAAVAFLKSFKEVKQERLTLIGFYGGGYLALKASETVETPLSCVLLGLPEGFMGEWNVEGIDQQGLSKLLNYCGYGSFNVQYMDTITGVMKRELEEIRSGAGEAAFFLGKNLPVSAARQYLARKPYEAMVNHQQPVMVIIGTADMARRPDVITGLTAAEKNNDYLDVVTVRNLEPFSGKTEYSGKILQFKPSDDVIKLLSSRTLKWSENQL